MKKQKTYCRNCIAACGMEVTVDNNHIVAHEGDAEHPISQGYKCIKGAMAVEFSDSPRRLLMSKKRQGDGSFVDIDANVATSEIAQKLSQIVAEHGPRSIALYLGTAGNFNTLGVLLAKAWLHAVQSPNLYSSMTVDQSAKWVTACRMGIFASGKPLMEDLDVSIIAGANPVVSHLGHPYVPVTHSKPSSHIRNAQKRGAKFIVVDPRKSETARLADLHLQIIPGEDATLFAGIVNLILQNGWEDKEFCTQHVAHIDKLRQSVSGYTLDHVASTCGLPAYQIEEVTRLFAQAKRKLAGSVTATSMNGDCNLTEHLIETLNAICGAYRRAGDVVRNPGVLAPHPTIAATMPMMRTWEMEPKLRTQNVGLLFGEYPSALLPDEILSAGEDRVRALIVYGGNPVMAFPDPNKTLKAFENLELMVCVDPRMSETSKVADYVIAPTVAFERHDLTAYGDLTMARPFLQYSAPVLKKPDTVIDDWEFYWQISREMSLQLVMKPGLMITGVPYGAVPGGIDIDMENKPRPEQLMADYLSQSAVSLEQLQAAPGGILLEGGEEKVLAGEIVPGARLDVAPDDVVAELLNLRRRLTGNNRFTYRLTVRRTYEVMNSTYMDSSITAKRYPFNFLFMNDEDMAEEGISDGDRVRIESINGNIVGIAKHDPGLRRKVVSMGHMWGNVNGGDPKVVGGSHTARLVSGDPNSFSPINFMPRQTAIPVNVTCD